MPAKRPKADQMCPPGYHLVRGHRRTCQSGTVTWVDAHNRRNRKRALEILLSENLLYLYWNSNKTFKALPAIKGFPRNTEFDSAIQFWLLYWKDKGLLLPGIDPLVIKAIIAVESTFNPRAATKVKGSSARGLMQLTDRTRRTLQGIPNEEKYRELRHHYVRISAEEVFDPLFNIAAGIRWLAHKAEKIPKGAARDRFNTLKNYYSWNKEGEEYARKVIALYEDSK